MRARQSIIAISTVRASDLNISDIYATSNGSERMRSILSAMSVNLDRQSEWMVSLGRKSAIERISTLICDVFQRMRSAGFAYAGQCAMPLTQVELADITGLTPVHVNRVLRELRSLRLVELRSGWLHLLAAEELLKIADLNMFWYAAA